MSEYIKREGVVELFKRIAYDDWNQGASTSWATAYSEAAEIIRDIPAADVVEVVRCEDCRWGRKVCGNIECWTDINAPPEYHGYEWFCPNGERRSE